MSDKKAVVLLSGGLDSAVVLYSAKKQGFKCDCLIFDYGQRHKREIDSAERIARAAGVKSTLVRISLPWKGSSLLDRKISLSPAQVKPSAKNAGIPLTYVPGRNIIFLSFAVSFAEAMSAGAVFIGAHTEDYSGYPDCRPEFYRAFSKAVASGTKTGVEGRGIKIFIPLIDKTKAGIIKTGRRLGVPFQFTWSCYKGGKRPCGKCDSCFFRAKGFKDAGIKDPLLDIKP